MGLLSSVKNKLADYYHDSTLGRILLYPVKFTIDSFQFNNYQDKQFVIRKFKATFGFSPNLDKPETFNEKIQWLKLNDRTPLHTECADKLRVRRVVKATIGDKYLIPLLFETTDVKEIKRENMPQPPFVIKTNHDSGNVFIIRDLSEVSFSDIRAKLKASMRHNYYHTSREWQYKHVRPAIMIEKLIEDESGGVPKDYKIHCFNGIPKFIQVDSDRFTEHKRNLFSTDWEPLPYIFKYPGLNKVSKPNHLNLMLKLAEELCAPFSFARIDFYDTGENVYFGEITFHPESGFGNFEPEAWDKKLGSELKLEKTREY